MYLNNDITSLFSADGTGLLATNAEGGAGKMFCKKGGHICSLSLGAWWIVRVQLSVFILDTITRQLSDSVRHFALYNGCPMNVDSIVT